MTNLWHGILISDWIAKVSLTASLSSSVRSIVRSRCSVQRTKRHLVKLATETWWLRANIIAAACEHMKAIIIAYKTTAVGWVCNLNAEAVIFSNAFQPKYIELQKLDRFYLTEQGYIVSWKIRVQFSEKAEQEVLCSGEYKNVRRPGVIQQEQPQKNTHQYIHKMQTTKAVLDVSHFMTLSTVDCSCFYGPEHQNRV